MKKYLLLLISAAALSISCTKGGLLETPATYAAPIEFEPYIGKAPVTKAENSDVDFLKKEIAASAYSGGFKVLAFEYDPAGEAPTTFLSEYMDVNVGWDAVSDTEEGWVCDVVHYWPEDQNLTFAAVGLNALNGDCMVRQNDLVNYTFEVKQKASEQVDLIVAPYQTGWNATKNDGVVNLKFEHILSRIGFKVLSTDPTDVGIAIRSIRLCGIFPTYGDLNLTALNKDGKPYITAKDGASDTFTYEYSLFEDDSYSFIVSSDECYKDEAGEPAPAEIYPNARLDAETSEWKSLYSDEDAIKIAKNRRYMMVMPYDQTPAANAHLEVVYQLTEGEPRTASVPLGNITFAPNTTYEFILSVSTATIEFDATLETSEWDRAQDANGNNLPNEVIPLFPEI